MNRTIKYFLSVALCISLVGCSTQDEIRGYTKELNRIGNSYAADLRKADTDEERFSAFKRFITSPKVRETVTIAARKTAQAAAMAVLQAGIGQLDREKKSNLLQGLSGALWTQVPAVINADTVEEIARVWTPDKSHWEALAKALAEDFERNPPKSPEDAQAILSAYAEGLYLSTQLENK